METLKYDELHFLYVLCSLTQQQFELGVIHNRQCFLVPQLPSPQNWLITLENYGPRVHLSLKIFTEVKVHTGRQTIHSNN